MTMKLFSRKNKKASKKRQRRELKVVEGVDFTSRKRLWNHICTIRREMLITDKVDNRKAPSTY